MTDLGDGITNDVVVKEKTRNAVKHTGWMIKNGKSLETTEIPVKGVWKVIGGERTNFVYDLMRKILEQQRTQNVERACSSLCRKVRYCINYRLIELMYYAMKVLEMVLEVRMQEKNSIKCCMERNNWRF